jgi:cytochrome c553
VRALATSALGIALLLLAARGGAAQSVPASDYALQCRGCHGADGAGVIGRVPSLAGVAALLETPEGRMRLLAVPGVRQASLSDERLAALLEWVALRFAPPGAAVAPLTAGEVARHRSHGADRNGAETETRAGTQSVDESRDGERGR